MAGVNPIRLAAGRVYPGAARTRADREPEWRYLPVRRLALFVEASIERSTHWVAFEPNDERLWAELRVEIGDFLQALFVQGAFHGFIPEEAFFVRCDRTTMSDVDVETGRVRCLVGFTRPRRGRPVVLPIELRARPAASAARLR